MLSISASLLVLGTLSWANAHEKPQFPGQNINAPPEVHHQGQMHKQPPPAHSNPPPQGARSFGGDQAHDTEHIKEHLDGKVDPTVNMTAEQLQFHYFNMHDIDRNGLLDGLELIKAITHYHDGNGNSAQHDRPPPPVLSDAEIERMLDEIFRTDDWNNDGYISYAEFSKAQKQREMEAKRQHQGNAS